MYICVCVCMHSICIICIRKSEEKIVLYSKICNCKRILDTLRLFKYLCQKCTVIPLAASFKCPFTRLERYPICQCRTFISRQPYRFFYYYAFLNKKLGYIVMQRYVLIFCNKRTLILLDTFGIVVTLPSLPMIFLRLQVVTAVQSHHILRL